MIGAGTMRAERYGRIVSDPDLRAYREQTGLAEDPLGVIVTNRLDLPWDAGLFSDGGGRVVVFTASDEEPPETATPVTVIRHEDRVDLPKAMAWLRGEGGIRSVLCEGGPHLHGELRAAGLADELFLTIAPKLAGGVAPHILEGTLGEISGSGAGLAAGVGGRAVRALPKRGRLVAFTTWTSIPAPPSSRCWSESRRSWTSTSTRTRRR